jgi:SAM-dependent methyltransferase
MEVDYEKKYHEVESENWWFVSRRKYLLDLLKDASKDSKIIDIGCSSGIFLKDLEQIGFKTENLFGVDISEKAINNCRKNGIKNAFVMDAQNINILEKFDIIIASDCLEHLEDDIKALENWKKLLKLGGKMYVFVPAFQSLWSVHDEVNRHFRRYTNNDLKTKLQNVNLTILKSSYWNFSLFIPVYIYRKISVFLPKSEKEEGQIVGNNLINKLLLYLVLFENILLRFVNFPFGVSTFCVVENNDNK